MRVCVEDTQRKSYLGALPTLRQGGKALAGKELYANRPDRLELTNLPTRRLGSPDARLLSSKAERK